MLYYTFKEQIIHGKSFQIIEVASPYRMLGDLSSNSYSTASEIEHVILNLDAVIAGLQESFSWGATDNCTLLSKKEITEIEYDFGESDSEIRTVEVLKLMQDWLAYLQRQPQPA